VTFASYAFLVGRAHPVLARQWLEFFLYNITTDYVSLFLIRFWLQAAGERPLFALCVGALLGFATVFAVYIVIDVVTFSLKTWTFHPVYFIQDVINWYDFIRTRGGVNRVFFSSALVVHSWLLLFAFGVVVVQLLNYFRSATRGVTWFLKRGREHPLEAVGFVGPMAVFLVAAGIVVIRSLIA
jgi:hypothetical protein